MLDLSKYSCDKCKREGSWHCKRCWHTVNKKPTRFKPKKKTGVQTPELRKPTPPPPPPTSGSNAVKPNQNYILPNSIKVITDTCPLLTPCGWCTKWDKKCDKKIGCCNEQSTSKKKDPSLEYIKSGKGLPPLGTDNTEIPGIRLERIR